MSIYKILNKIRIQIRKGIAFVYITLINNIWYVWRYQQISALMIIYLEYFMVSFV